MTNEQILDAANGSLDDAIQLLDLFRERVDVAGNCHPSIEKPMLEETTSTSAS
jgi:hypothetical protein